MKTDDVDAIDKQISFQPIPLVWRWRLLIAFLSDDDDGRGGRYLGFLIE